MTLTPDCKQWLRFPQLARYGCWLEQLLGMALPEEDLPRFALEFRREPAGTVDPEVDGLHADGSYLRSVVTLSRGGQACEHAEVDLSDEGRRAGRVPARPGNGIRSASRRERYHPGRSQRVARCGRV
jgi:hypothetical protein